MFPEQLKKILNLVKKTGDRVIIFDASAPDDSYVIMGLDNYAASLDNAPAVKIAKIQEAPANTPIMADLSANSEEKENLTEEDLTDKINREISMWKNRENSVFLGEENKPKKAWQIPSKVKDKAQEIE
ncbi:MAG: hypothetical protein WC719_00460 [Patescibacteria group bacterium]|jgi:hypothetical protein